MRLRDSAFRPPPRQAFRRPEPCESPSPPSVPGRRTGSFGSFPLILRAFLVCFVLLPFSAFARDASPDADRPNEIKKLDVSVAGKRVSLKFTLYERPSFEILENFSNRVLTIKFFNTRMRKKDKVKVRFFNDLLRGGEMLKAGEDETWFLINTNFANLGYEVAPNPEGLPELELSFRTIEKKPSLPADDTPRLLSASQSKTQRGERLVMVFSQAPDLEYRIDTLPYFRAEFSVAGFEIDPEFRFDPFASELVRRFEFSENDEGTSFTLTPFRDFLSLKIAYRKSPHRAILDYEYAEPAKSFDPGDVQRYVEENREDANLTALRNFYVRAENEFRAKRWDQAAKLFKALSSSSPDSRIGVRALFRAADAYHMKGEANPDEESFSFVVQEYGFAVAKAELFEINLPELERAYFNMGYNYFKGEFYDLAEEYFRETIRRFPESAYANDARYHLGILYQKTGKFRDSIRTFERLIEEKPDSIRVNRSLYYLGQNHFSLGEYEMARKFFNQGRNRDFSLFDEDPEMLFSQAETYFELDEFEKARSIYEKIIDRFKNFPKRGYVIVRLGDYHQETGQQRAALETYELAIDDRDVELAVTARMRIANMVAYHRKPAVHDRAIELYRLIAERFPDNPQAQTAKLMLAITHSIHGHHGKAIEAFEDFARDYPENRYNQEGTLEKLLVNQVAGLIEKSYGDKLYNAVVLEYERHGDLLLRNPDYVPYLEVADGYAQIGKLEQANRVLFIAAENYSDERKKLAVYLLAKNYFETGQFRKTIETVNEHAGTDPDAYYSGKSLILLGRAYEALNLSVDAVRVFREFLANTESTTDPIYFDYVSEVWYYLGNLYKELGKYDQALESYVKAVDSFKHSIRNDSALEFIKLSVFYQGDMNFEMKDYGAALRDYGRASALYPDHERVPWTEYQKGYIYQLQGKEDEALAIYDRLIAEAGEQPLQLWARLAREGKREITLNRSYKRHLEDPNVPISKDS